MSFRKILDYLYGTEEEKDHTPIPEGQVDSEALLKELLQRNQALVNLFFSKLLVAVGGGFLLAALFCSLHIFDENSGFSLPISLLCAAVLLCTGFYGLLEKGNRKSLRRAIIGASVIACVLIQIMRNDSYWVFMLPILISSRYYDEEMIQRLTGIEIIASACSGTLSLLLKGNLERLPEAFQTFSLISFFKEEFETFFLMFLVLIFCALIAGFACRRGITMMRQMAETTELKQKLRLEAQKTKIDISISQIQPHFLYNTLTAIMAIDGNPEETIDAITDFGKYLRENLDAISGKSEIPIRMELEHVRRYVKLEQLRFKSRLKVNYQIRSENFLVPPLTVQMLVENAVKHGVTKKKQGGTVTIITEEDPDTFLIRVADDGIGFDPDHLPEDGKEHVGIENVRSRVEGLYHGTLQITSRIGEGTCAEIRIPKVCKEERSTYADYSSR